MEIATAAAIVDAKFLAYVSSAAVMRSGVGQFVPLIDAVEKAYLAHAKRDVVLPKAGYLRYANRPSYDRIIPLFGYLGGTFHVSGLKQICSSTSNGTRGFSRASGLIILNEPESNRPFGVMEASLISAARTAAVTGLALREFVRNDMARIAIVGCGQLGRTHLHMVVDVFGPDRFEFVAYDVVAECADQMVELSRTLGARLRTAPNARKAIEMADVVIPATTAENAYIEREWLKPNSLYSAVSLLDAKLDIYRDAALIVVDDLDQCLHEGRPLDVLRSQGELPIDRIVEIGAYLTDRSKTKVDGGQIVFNPMGTVITDLAVAKTLFDRAFSNGDFISLEI